jgi:hypothetical protein
MHLKRIYNTFVQLLVKHEKCFPHKFAFYHSSHNIIIKQNNNIKTAAAANAK